MPKTFYTERDIEDLAKRGVISLIEDDDVVLTDIARDKAMRLGIELIHEHDQPPSAPERPYITKLSSPTAEKPAEPTSREAGVSYKASLGSKASGKDDLHAKVRAEVIARLGDSIDVNLLDTIIRRVLQNIG